MKLSWVQIKKCEQWLRDRPRMFRTKRLRKKFWANPDRYVQLGPVLTLEIVKKAYQAAYGPTPDLIHSSSSILWSTIPKDPGWVNNPILIPLNYNR